MEFKEKRNVLLNKLLLWNESIKNCDLTDFDFYKYLRKYYMWLLNNSNPNDNEEILKISCVSDYLVHLENKLQIERN